MQYKLLSVVATSALFALGSAAPIASPETFGITNPPSTIDLGKPSSEVTWSKRTAGEPNPDDVQLGPPSTEVIWSRRAQGGSAGKLGEDSFTLGKAKTTVTWDRRSEQADPDTIGLGKPSSEVTWG
ncbi:hypothetical protein DDE82_008609 [Stemphylium lycopersici]|uniref:Uncharacterized protein n=1 Tax=Stemphylium lycopersici TaxID=183478 RepID=A0A364N0I7_STELY|nr:hypothetical protein TW65_07975 [Stemphylium lycopersici]RAQ99100.1 hypothetical protein DDE82_008609 [Stemphylium lycopersici]RAR08044.1 hypothetical protein DDE83_006144 [Stemphylium lycopersici]